MSSLVPMVASTVVAATPLIYAALGETVVERSGVLNLGVEGMMLIGAVSGFAATLATGSDAVGFIAASSLRPIKPAVSGVNGTCTLKKSQEANPCRRSVTGSTSISRNAASGRKGS